MHKWGDGVRHKARFVYICVLICVFAFVILACCMGHFMLSKKDARVEPSISEFEIDPQVESSMSEFGIDPNGETVVEGCIILKDDDSLFIHVEEPASMWGGIWVIDPSDTEFISHNASIVDHTDLRLGMMVQFLFHDEFIQSIFPTPLYDVEYVETWGEYNTELYKAGVDCYNKAVGYKVA